MNSCKKKSSDFAVQKKPDLWQKASVTINIKQIYFIIQYLLFLFYSCISAESI